MQVNDFVWFNKSDDPFVSSVMFAEPRGMDVAGKIMKTSNYDIYWITTLDALNSKPMPLWGIPVGSVIPMTEEEVVLNMLENS